MSANPHNVKQAREALGARLRELRQQVGLTGKGLAESLGWQATKVSKIELGRQTPTASDITAWTRATRADNTREELLASLRSLELQYAEWRRILRAGTRAGQVTHADLEAKSTLIRAFETTSVPGLLQTAGYAHQRLAEGIQLHGLADDLDDGVRARLSRQEILYQPGRRFHFVVTEAVLRYRTCPPDVLAGQLDRLLALASMPSLVIGVLPFTTALPVAPRHGFWIYDDRLVQVETFAAELNLVQPHEIQLYSNVFQQLASVAVYGSEARKLITRAIADLGELDTEDAAGHPVEGDAQREPNG